MRRKLLKVLGALVLLVAALVIGFVVWVELTWEIDYSSVPLPDLHASDDPEVIARGRYLVHGPAHCSACHSVDHFSEGARLADEPPPALDGGHVIELPFGVFRARNLTPHATGIGSRTDQELARTLHTGVLHDGSLSVFMVLATGPLSDVDVTAIISYLRSMEPVANPVGPSEPNFIGHAFLAVTGLGPRRGPPPRHVEAGAEPRVARGRYLAHGPAACVFCHTRVDPGAGFAPTGAIFSGSDPEPDEDGMEMVAPNLTPHPTAGHLRGWSEDRFVRRLRSGERRVRNSKMAWENFTRITESDARSIYRYLRTVRPSPRRPGPIHRRAGSYTEPAVE